MFLGSPVRHDGRHHPDRAIALLRGVGAGRASAARWTAPGAGRLSGGGELPGALTYAVETAPQRAGLACGVIILCVNGGVLVATLVNLGIRYALPPADVAAYRWRVAFMLGGLIGSVSYLMRRSLEELPEFLRMRFHPASPTSEVLREHWKAVLTAAGVVAAVGGFTGMLHGFVPAYLVQTLHYSPSQTALAMTTALLASSAGLIAAGRAGDYLPRPLILRVGAALLIVTIFPIWSLIAAGSEHLVLLLGALSLAFSIVSGIWPSIVATLFPTRIRFSGIALSYNLSITILSGFAPLAASGMIERTGMLIGPAVYIAACAFLTFVSSFAVARVSSRSASLLSRSWRKKQRRAPWRDGSKGSLRCAINERYEEELNGKPSRPAPSLCNLSSPDASIPIFR